MSVSLDKTRSSIARGIRAARWNERLRRNDLDALRRQLAIQAHRAAK
ncbi:hypothetical protein [Streptomyces phage phiScoe56]|nr:hypothetical protein [Streptomyces phage phiScoe56]